MYANWLLKASSYESFLATDPIIIISDLSKHKNEFTENSVLYSFTGVNEHYQLLLVPKFLKNSSLKVKTFSEWP